MKSFPSSIELRNKQFDEVSESIQGRIDELTSGFDSAERAAVPLD